MKNFSLGSQNKVVQSVEQTRLEIIAVLDVTGGDSHEVNSKNKT